MQNTQQQDRAGHPFRTPTGDVILRATRPDGDPATGRRPGPGDGADGCPGGGAPRTGLRAVAIALGILALAAALVAGVAIAGSAGVRGGAGPGSAPPASAQGAPLTTGTAPATRPVRPYPTPSAGVQSTVDDPGGVAGARSRVAGFVAALNDSNFERANSFLCNAMAGTYDASSLDGIEPGSLQVGGVSVQGSMGTAVVTYQPTDATDPGRVIFRLIIQHGAWMICTPQ